MSTINSVHTACKNCVFAKYEEITQTDCHLNYINIFKNNNIEILEAYDETHEFNIINNKKCIGYRENKWFDQFGLTNAELIDKINKYNELNYLHYVVIINLQNYSIQELEASLDEINTLQYKPQKLILVRYVDDRLEFGYDKLKSLLEKYNNIQWRIQTILEKTFSYEMVLHTIVTTNKYRFIISVTSPCEQLSNIINYANQIVHNDLKTFNIISNNDKTCIIFSGSVYRYASAHNENILMDATLYELYNPG